MHNAAFSWTHGKGTTALLRHGRLSDRRKVVPHHPHGFEFAPYRPANGLGVYLSGFHVQAPLWSKFRHCVPICGPPFGRAFGVRHPLPQSSCVSHIIKRTQPARTQARVILPSMLARVCVSRNIRIHFFAFLYVNGIEWPEPKKPPQAATCKGYGLYFPAIGPF